MRLAMTTLFAALTAVSALSGPALAADELKLGYLTATTGPYVALSRSNQIAAFMAVEEINAKGGVKGKKIKLITFDTAGKPEQAVVGLRKLAEDDQVLAIVGPFSSGEARVAFAAGERTGIVTMPMASSAPKLAEPFKYGFRNTSDEGYMFSKVMATLKEKKMPMATGAVAYATDDTISKVMGTRVLPAIMKKMGVDMKGEVTFNLASFDLSPQVSQLMQAKTDLVGVGAPPEAAIKLAKEMRRQGHKGRLIAGSTIADPDLPRKMGEAGNGTTIPTTFYADLDDRTKAFTEEFRKRAKAEGSDRTEPAQFDAATYDIVLFYAWAMEQAGVTGDVAKLKAERTGIRDALAKMKNYPALEGPISFGADGDALKPVYIIEIKDGQWKLIDKHAAG
jgi:branched-chain amino acid transport system substrate-binding protein